MASKNVIELKPVKKKQNSSNEVSQPISLNDEVQYISFFNLWFSIYLTMILSAEEQ